MRYGDISEDNVKSGIALSVEVGAELGTIDGAVQPEKIRSKPNTKVFGLSSKILTPISDTSGSNWIRTIPEYPKSPPLKLATFPDVE